MERLSLHIEYLLLRHDCVVVPGIGAFLNVYHPAEYNSATRIYRPMQREIRFNGALIHDDGVLAHSYARKYRRSFQEGREMLLQDTNAFIRMLEEEGELTIGRIGTIRREEENVVFHPMRTPDNSCAEIGLHEIGLKKTAKTGDSPKREAETTEIGNQPIRFNTRRNYYIPINKIFARAAAGIVVVLAVALAAINPPQPGVGREDRASVVPFETIYNSARVLMEMATENAEGDEADSKPEENATVAEESQAELPYCLIVGTFRTKKEADAYITSKGTETGLESVSGGKLWRVSARRSSSREELQKELNDPKFRETYGEGWIWNSLN